MCYNESVMMTTIQLEQETVLALEASARAKGMSLSDYLRSVALNGEAGQARVNGVVGSVAEFDSLLDGFFAQNPQKLPSLPATFSRADIYVDHD